MGLAPLTLTIKNFQNFCFLSLQLWALLVWRLGFQDSNTNGSTELKSETPPWPFWGPCAMETQSEGPSVMSYTFRPHRLYSPWNSPGQDTGVGSLSLLQAIFPTQETNWGLLHCRWILYQLSFQRSPWKQWAKNWGGGITLVVGVINTKREFNGREDCVWSLGDSQGSFSTFVSNSKE